MRKLFWLSWTAIVCMASAFAQSGPQVPDIIQTAIADTRKDCPSIILKPDFVTKRDINGDGREDYILNYGNLICDEPGSLYCGSAGCLMEVYVSLPDGTFPKVLNENVRDLRFKMINGQSAMVLQLHGTYCGKVGSQSCSATRYWNGKEFSKALAPASAKATNTLDVPVIEFGDGSDAASCTSSRVTGLKAGEDGFLAVRSGPGSQFRKLAELHNGEMIFVYEKRGEWAGIVYRTESARCHAAETRPVPYINKGWVHSRWLADVAG